MEDFIDNFPDECSYYGIQLPKDEIIHKCATLALEYGWDLEKFFEQWISFTFYYNKSDEKTPTVHNMPHFEKFVAENEKNSNKKDIKIEILDTKENIVNVTEPSSEKKRHRSEDEELGKEAKRPKEEANEDVKIIDIIKKEDLAKNENLILSVDNEDPDKFYIDVGTEEKDYKFLMEYCLDFSERKDPLKKLVSYCVNDGIKRIATFKNKNNDVKKVDINVFAGDKPYDRKQFSSLAYDSPFIQQKCLSNQIDHICKLILDENGLDKPTDYSCIPYKPESAITYGKIKKLKDGKFSKDSVGIEASMSLGNGQIEKLYFNNLTQETALFPGQLVAMKASKGRNGIDVDTVYSNLTTKLPVKLPDFNFEEPLQVVVAVGPFTILKNSDFEPLMALMAYVHEHRPHVLILIGPFVEQYHGKFITKEPIENHFEKILSGIMKNLKEDNLDTQVVLMSNHEDIYNVESRYPTPEYKISQMENLHLVPDPCVLDINRLRIGATSVDIFHKLSCNEIVIETPSNPPKSRISKLDRLVNYILTQRNFYPFYPNDKSFPLNIRSAVEYCAFSETPHIMILPSQFNYFVKDINGCIVINPQKLVRMAATGSFARFELHNKNRDKNLTHSSIKEDIFCEILNI